MDIVLIIAILISIPLTFFIVKIWRKKYFVKELYISEGASIVFAVILIVSTIIHLTLYFIATIENSYLHFLILFLYDILLEFVFSITATTCIYLKDEILVKKNIFITKKILLNRETKIIEKSIKTIVKSPNTSISLRAGHLSGSINNLIYTVKMIINRP
ncbi:MAG: hypothetical protein IKM16_04310 [Clostridia bacterium]|nr:hypothetical protein [Clostridia bacterium]